MEEGGTEGLKVVFGVIGEPSMSVNTTELGRSVKKGEYVERNQSYSTKKTNRNSIDVGNGAGRHTLLKVTGPGTGNRKLHLPYMVTFN